MQTFDENRLYSPHDDELRVIGSVELLCQWRHKRKGPAYTKIGAKVLYSGDDLNAWLTAQRVESFAA